jgi:twinkle protein
VTGLSDSIVSIANFEVSTMALSERHCELLEARGLDTELLERFGVASSRRGSDWIEIPYFQRGEIVNHKFRTVAGPKQFCQDAEAKKCFWNSDAITDPSLAHLPLIITEGEFDALAAIQCGHVRTVSVPDGAPATPHGADEGGKKYSYLDEFRAALRDCSEIILAVDSDGPGTNLLNDLALRLGRSKCKWVKYPKGCKDLNDALARYGQRGVIQTIANATWCKIEGLYLMDEIPPKEPDPGIDIGVACLAKHYRMRLGDLCIVSGIPGHGKTTFVNEIAGRMALDHGWHVAVASFEQSPQTDHKRALRTFYGRKPAKYQNADELRAADHWINDKFVFILQDEDEDATLLWLLERCQAAIIRYGAKLIVVDPWNEIDHDRPRDMTMTEYTGFAIKQFRKLAAKYQVHVIVVAHPTKIARDKSGNIPMPSLYDISDSANWANKADVGIIVHRDDGKTLIRIAKTRYSEIGEVGTLEATYLRDQARYEIIDPAALL